VREHAIAHEAAVDERVLAAALRRVCGRTAKPPTSHRTRLDVDLRGAANDSPSSASTRRADLARQPERRAPLCCSVNATSGWASATRRNASSQWPHSVAAVRRNFRRAGVL
jgi:hypothetical protein